MNPRESENVEYVAQGRTAWPIMGMPRKARVKGMAGIDATVVVTVVQDKVWLSISPPFTWEAIMEPGKVDEVISMLETARNEAGKAATTRNRSAFPEGQVTAQATTRDGSALVIEGNRGGG